MLDWRPDPQPNGAGWMTACGNYAIRQCVYDDPAKPDEYWCYYKVGAHWHHLYPGVFPGIDQARARCLEAYMASEEWRFLCECRDWIGRGYTTKAKLAELGQRIAAKRGRPAAERLYKGIVAILREKAKE